MLEDSSSDSLMRLKRAELKPNPQENWPETFEKIREQFCNDQSSKELARNVWEFPAAIFSDVKAICWLIEEGLMFVTGSKSSEQLAGRVCSETLQPVTNINQQITFN